MRKIGIVAGNGNLPLIAARTAGQQGCKVYVCAIKGETDASIVDLVTEVMWVKLGELKKLSQFFLKRDVRDICFDGKITKTSLFRGEVKPDLDMVMLFAKLRDRKDDTILGAICDYLEAKGLVVIDSTTFLGECLPGKGVLTKTKLSKKHEQDIAFGWELAKESARLDIGQSVVVKDTAVLAIEAIEGTDEAIKRGGILGKSGVVVVKVAKPNQDMRFDVPTIGPNTIAAMQEVDAKVLAFEAGKTILVAGEDVVRAANKSGITIVGV